MHEANEKRIDGVNKSKAGLLSLHTHWRGVLCFKNPSAPSMLDLVTSPQFLLFNQEPGISLPSQLVEEAEASCVFQSQVY